MPNRKVHESFLALVMHRKLLSEAMADGLLKCDVLLRLKLSAWTSSSPESEIRNLRITLISIPECG